MSGKRQQKTHRVFEESAQLRGKFTLRNTGIPVETILILLDEWGEDLTRARFPSLRDRDFDICRTIAAHRMPDRPEFRKNGPKARVNILFDENIPHTIVEKSLNKISRLAHVSFHGLTSDRDENIWRYATDNGFHVIVTNDDDFLKIAELQTLKKLGDADKASDVDLNDQPLVVHLDPSIRDPALTEDACRKRIQNFVKEAERTPRRCAYILMSANGLRYGPNADGIYQKYIRGSLHGSPLLAQLPEKPVFDKAIMDHRGIDSLAKKFNFESFAFSREPSWQKFYKRAYAAKQRALKNDP